MTAKKRAARGGRADRGGEAAVEPDACRKGIFLTDEFLARKDLKLPEKILYLLIKRELETKHRHFTSALTNGRLAAMTRMSETTVKRILRELKKKGFIATVVQNWVVEKDKYDRPKKTRGVRYIYLDKKLAGYRERAINKARKSKKPVELLYSLFVQEGRMTSKAYSEWKANGRRQERETEEQEEKRRYQEEFAESLADLSEEQVAELERECGAKTGTYVKIRREFLKEQKELEALIGSDDDGLFDDAEADKPKASKG